MLSSYTNGYGYTIVSTNYLWSAQYLFLPKFVVFAQNREVQKPLSADYAWRDTRSAPSDSIAWKRKYAGR